MRELEHLINMGRYPTAYAQDKFVASSLFGLTHAPGLIGATYRRR